MKSYKEFLEEVRENNMYTKVSRDVDLIYHEEVLIPRHSKIKDEKERIRVIGNDNNQIKNIKILIEDCMGIDKIIEGMIKEGKK